MPGGWTNVPPESEIAEAIGNFALAIAFPNQFATVRLISVMKQVKNSFLRTTSHENVNNTFSTCCINCSCLTDSTLTIFSFPFT